MKIGNKKIVITLILFTILCGTLITSMLYVFNEYTDNVKCKTLKQDYNSLPIPSPTINCEENFKFYSFGVHNSQLKEANNNIQSWEKSNSEYKNKIVQDLTDFNNAKIEGKNANFKSEDPLLSIIQEHTKILNQNQELFSKADNLKNVLDSYKLVITDQQTIAFVDEIKTNTPFQLLPKIDKMNKIVEDVNTKFLSSRTNKQSLGNEEYLKLKSQLKTFTASNFLNLSDETITLEEKPVNTTLYSLEADKRIYKLAFERGYKYRISAQLKDLTGTNELDLNIEARSQLQNLVTAGSLDGVVFKLVSGYRDEGLQKTIFTSRLQQECRKFLARDCKAEDIVAGKVDNAIEEVLKTSSVPGTSKHHTGLTIDINENGIPLTSFKDTKSYRWISEDNYFNAKRFGFVPSYPTGGEKMGPDPEPWEYIYVGVDKLKK